MTREGSWPPPAQPLLPGRHTKGTQRGDPSVGGTPSAGPQIVTPESDSTVSWKEQVRPASALRAPRARPGVCVQPVPPRPCLSASSPSWAAGGARLGPSPLRLSPSLPPVSLPAVSPVTQTFSSCLSKPTFGRLRTPLALAPSEAQPCCPSPWLPEPSSPASTSSCRCFHHIPGHKDSQRRAAVGPGNPVADDGTALCQRTEVARRGRGRSAGPHAGGPAVTSRPVDKGLRRLSVVDSPGVGSPGCEAGLGSALACGGGSKSVFIAVTAR